MSLRLDWCNHAAAKWAVRNWHYSQTMPAGKLVKVGVWEDGEFIGAVIFGRGASNNIGSPYELEQTEVCELVRIALKEHQAPVSQIATIAIKMLRQHSNGLRLIVSYADPQEGHSGAIYQAMNWIYVGQGQPDQRLILPSGKVLHSRQFSSSGVKVEFGVAKRVPTPNDGEVITVPGKHKYLYPLDRAMRRQIEPLAQEYPKRADA